MFLSLKTLYRKRTVIWPFYFYTIIRTLSTKARNYIGNHIKRSKSLETKEVRRVSIYASSLVYKNRGKE